jgi:putative spermidine/putrescine transport system ATP-binding protein/putrescine transport system ATP-binding protein
MSIVELRNVVKRFGSTVALDGISFSIEAGQIVSLLGPSGCGKTTTLRMIAGFEHPDSGSLTIAGIEMKGKRPYERNVGLLFQDYALFPHMTVKENISYGPRIRRLPSKEVDQRVSSLIELTRLAGLGARRPSELSGGQQQRVALARALATSPQLLLLDEPLSALDAKLRQELQIELKEMLVAIGRATIIVTHDQDEAMALSERVIVMDRGRIMQDGTPSEIYRRPGNRFVAEFIGRSNWFVGRLGEPSADDLRVLHTTEGQRLAVHAPHHQGGTAVDVCVRPEHIKLSFGDGVTEIPLSNTNMLDGRLTTTIQIGSFRHYVVDLAPGKRILVVEQDRSEQQPAPGTSVRACFSARDCIVIPAEDAPPANPTLSA